MSPKAADGADPPTDPADALQAVPKSSTKGNKTPKPKQQSTKVFVDAKGFDLSLKTEPARRVIFVRI